MYFSDSVKPYEANTEDEDAWLLGLALQSNTANWSSANTAQTIGEQLYKNKVVFKGPVKQKCFQLQTRFHHDKQNGLKHTFKKNEKHTFTYCGGTIWLILGKPMVPHSNISARLYTGQC